MAKSEFDEFIQQEVNKIKGTAIPVKCGLVERLFTKKMACSRMYPNPEDEFSFPDIGPNYEIVSDYVKQIKENQKHGLPPFEEPILVEKLHPHGYMLINGHHRWAAAMRLHLKKVPVKIINLARESDIMKILENSQHDKRATLDLDEVIFRDDDAPFLEKKLGFPYSIRYKQRIKLGIPALFYTLSKHGYDIWVYSSRFYSYDDIKDFFRCYRVHVDGIITGIVKDKKVVAEKRPVVEKLFSNKYKVTLHIDNNMILRTVRGSSDFLERELDASDELWSKKAASAIEEMEKNEKS
ncbi:MAG: ParB/RepB/Spo0J family partition protein [Lachnospiraceae bacterium]|nr:ParB/RepB/Spo0J family partition protein [Lachnospiraceae bacterium]